MQTAGTSVEVKIAYLKDDFYKDGFRVVLLSLVMIVTHIGTILSPLKMLSGAASGMAAMSGAVTGGGAGANADAMKAYEDMVKKMQPGQAPAPQ